MERKYPVLAFIFFIFCCICENNYVESATAPLNFSETKCKYINGVVDQLYEEKVQKNESLTFIFHVERRYFLDLSTNVRVEAEVGNNATLSQPVRFSIELIKLTTTIELPSSSSNDNKTISPIYYSAGRNLCIQTKDAPNEGQNITVRVSTARKTPVRFRLKFVLLDDFQMKLGTEREITISPTDPRYFGFQSIAPDVSVVKLKAVSESSLCMTLSVQPPDCPVFDREYNVKYRGLWQTMTLQTAMTIELTERFKNGLFIVLVAHDSDDKCSKSTFINPYEPPPGITNRTTQDFDFFQSIFPRMKSVRLMITNESNVEEGTVLLVMFIPVMSTFLLILIVALLYRNRHEWMRVEGEHKLATVNGALLSSPNNGEGTIPPPEDGESSGIVQSDQVLSPTTTRPPSVYLMKAPVEKFYEVQPQSDGGGFRWKANLTISHFERKDLAGIRKSGKRFYWTIIIIAIFYCIPVYQLILHYLRVLYRTGEYDICYYNYLCAHRLGVFVDFNHFWSNVSYVIFGFAFVYFVNRRARNMVVVEEYENKRAADGSISFEGGGRGWRKWCGFAKVLVRADHGIPQNWGIFYALGIALAMEGVLSAAYHLCPNQSSFQFDTCFMYVIAVLILLKIYQFRHTVHFGANHTFLILAAFVLISVIGLMFEFHDSQSKLVYRWMFIGVQFLTSLLLSLYFYALGYVRSQDDSRIMTDFRLLRNLNQLQNKSWNGDRLILPAISFLLGISVLIYCEIANIDFATYLLYVLVSNVIGFTTYYVGIMKPLHGEFKNGTFVQPAIYFVGAAAIGGFAVTYFVRSPATWELSAAASRAVNEECLRGWFPFYPYYDSHDVWHFLSAASLFLSFMGLLIVDDDILTVPQSRIPVF